MTHSVDIAVNAMIDNVFNEVDKSIFLDIQYDGVCSVKSGLLQTWFERDNTTLVINNPEKGWSSDLVLLPNIYEKMATVLSSEHDNILKKLKCCNNQWDSLDIDLKVKQLFTNNSELANTVKITERPIYLICERTLTNYDKPQRKLIVGYLILAAVTLMTYLIEEVDHNSIHTLAN